MKKVWLWLLCLTLVFLGGCGRKEDPNILTGICTPVWEAGIPEDAVDSTVLVEMEDGYRLAAFSSNDAQYLGEKGTYWEAAESAVLLELNHEGAVQKETPLTFYGISGKMLPDDIGERGIYYWNRGTSVLLQADWDGNITAEADMSEYYSVTDFSRIYNEYFVRETENGTVVYMDGTFLFLDTALEITHTVVMPEGTKVTSLWPEGETIWYTCLTDQVWNVLELGKIEDGVPAEETWTVPDAVAGQYYMDWKPLIGYEDGWMYSWNSSVGVFRWKAEHKQKDEEPDMEVVFSFLNSGIVGTQVTDVAMLTDGTFALQFQGRSAEVRLERYAPAPDRDLSGMTVLTLACRETNAVMENAVLEYNRTHPDTYIKIVSYAQYDSPEERRNGVSQFDLDLETGLLQADILVGRELDPLDLYPYMTGRITPEDLAGSVKEAMEEDGELHSIAAYFACSALAGKTEELNGMTEWTMEEFLDFAEGLQDGEYLIEEVGLDNFSRILFRDTQYASFIRDGKAEFDSPLYIRYLEWMKSLPKTGQTYSTGYSIQADILAGVYTEEELIQMGPVEDGQNLYYTGDIKLFAHELQSTRTGATIQNMFTLMEMCNMLGSRDLTFIGYPTPEGSGVLVQYTSSSYSIPSTCKDPARAWEFIESILLASDFEADTEIDSLTDLQKDFTTWKEPYARYLENLKGTDLYIGYERNNYLVGQDITLDENGRYQNQPGSLTELDDTVIALAEVLYTHGRNINAVPDALQDIAEEEESRYLAGAITAEECAEIVQSRVSIYLAENE